MQQQLRRALGLPDKPGEEMGRRSRDPQVEAVRDYMSGRFTGATFETVGTNDRDHFTSDDVLAVTMLSIGIGWNRGDVSALSIVRLFDQEATTAPLLRELPDNQDLHSLNAAEFDELLGADSPGDRLYTLLRKDVGLPRVATHKLLARKRPRLIPIRDSVVETALGMQRSPSWWRPWWEVLSTDQQIIDRLGAIRLGAGVSQLSLLRVADITIWGRDRAAVNTSDSGQREALARGEP